MTGNGIPPPGPTALVVAPPQQSESAKEFELMQRQAKLFSSSPLVPEHIRDGGSEKGLANCYIALVLAKQMDENPLVVMQNIYIVHGRAGWSASYMIAKANASGIFKGVIRFRHTGEGPKRACTAAATLADTGEVVEATVSMEMAAAEGWTKNAKYKSMPDQMLIYRAATFLVRTYCPQVMLGYRSHEELVDMEAASLPTSPKLSIASVTADPVPDRPVNRIAQVEPLTPNPSSQMGGGTEEREDQAAFRKKFGEFLGLGGDEQAFCMAGGFADLEKVVASTKPALSKQLTRLHKAIEELQGDASLPGMEERSQMIPAH